MTVTVSPRRRRDIVDALRRGTVPSNGLDVLAVGLRRFEGAVDAELDTVVGGGAVFKAVRGDYGSGKTFFARWVAERAKQRGLATAEVQISETETPLHKLETVYRRVAESLQTAEFPPSAFRPVLDAWLYALESEAPGEVDSVLERRLASVSQTTPAFSAALRAYRSATGEGETAKAEGLAAWLAGQPHVSSSVRRSAGVRGELDHFGAFGFLQGLLTVLRDSGHPGLLLVLDEVETLQRVRIDVREKALNALRQLIDEVDGGRFPGLYLVITGTPAFFEGAQGVQRLPPLAQRLATDFTTDARFDNPRAVQLRLPGFTLETLGELGRRVRDIFAVGAESPDRIATHVSDSYIDELAAAVTGGLGGQVGVAPRVYLKKLVGDILDRVDLYDDFDPHRDYKLTVSGSELTDVERNARTQRATSVDDVEL
ncbi:BREX system ATP-binding protein BrxD [Kribbella qitaiheensis]|uniref:BREX system ATP-binding protein BrxD n=1 Tax=Kribbella qitaiheensis TaxID=1544730 RepID=UPI00360E475D